MHVAKFDECWQEYFEGLDNNVKTILVKKIKRILEYPFKRHLFKQAKFFVSEAGQYRIIYRIFEENNEVRFYFVGKHKEYEKWYKQFF